MGDESRVIDADNHYYEALDSCTRYLDPKFKRRGVEVLDQGTYKVLLAGGHKEYGTLRCRTAGRVNI